MILNVDQIPPQFFKQPEFRTILQQIRNTGAKEIEIRVIDPRVISQEQKNKAHALLGEIAFHIGYSKTECKDVFYSLFSDMQNLQAFSLRDCTMTEAREFISMLIEFCVANSVPMEKPLYSYCMDDDTLYRHGYWSLENKKCAVTNRAGADLHHIDAVGMGFDRKVVHHKGRLAISLCREKHSEAHTIGLTAFFEKYHLCGVRLDAHLCKIHHLKE